LYFVGDLVNRGAHSLKVCRFLQALGPRAQIVLGNHDIGLLMVGYGEAPNKPHYTFQDILNAPDKGDILNWLRHQPLMHTTATHTFIHAGLYPFWDIETVSQLTQEVSAMLQAPDPLPLLKHLFGNTPTHWAPTLTGFSRARFIVNACTRMRYVSPTGDLELHTKVPPPPPGYAPWFTLKNPALRHTTIVFGHWAALQGQCENPHCEAIDTGCAWGHSLTALRLEDHHRFSVPMSPLDALTP
jgi:bis(5'-nucleosyl)-tetraphosphatase (symmetrical)